MLQKFLGDWISSGQALSNRVVSLQCCPLPIWAHLCISSHIKKKKNHFALLKRNQPKFYVPDDFSSSHL